MNLLYANDRPGAYPPSLYAAEAPLQPPRPALTDHITADVAIIGAGYTGLSAALHLAEAGVNVVVLEAHRVGWGASGRNGGQVATGQRVDQDVLETRLGKPTARELWDLGEEAKALVKSLIAEHGIDCDLTPGIAYPTRRQSDVPDYRRHAQHMAEAYGYEHITYFNRAETRAAIASPAYVAGVLDKGADHLNPLKYALGLVRAAEAAGAVIHENTRVTGLDRARPTVRTAHGSVRAEHILLATNGYMGDLVPEVSARVMPINNYIAATAPLPERGRELLPSNIAVADDRFVVNYFRLSTDGRLIFGGGESYSYRFPSDIKAFVRKPLVQVFPQLADVELTHAWGGTLAITRKRLPHLVRITPTILSASGYSGMGITLATHAGKLMADAVRGEAESFETIAALKSALFPGGPALRSPLLAAAMSWFALRDRM